MSAREEILARIAAAQVAPSAPSATVPRTAALDPAARRELFAERARDLGAQVTEVDAAGVGAAIEAILRRHGADRAAIPADLPDAWRPAGVELVEDTGTMTPAEVDVLGVGITAGGLGIATTGTVVLDGGPGQGRRVLSLVCDLHVCVVEADRLVDEVAEALDRTAAIIRATGRPVTLVSGTSATSDIELQRIEGVHGPRRLELVLTGGAGAATTLPHPAQERL